MAGPALIIVNQSGKPAGVAGKAREDLVTGTDVSLSAANGPYLAYAWSIIYKPIDINAGSRSSALLSAPGGSTSLLTPINAPGTYFIQLVVDSGGGLGFNPTDTTRLTFYCGSALNVNPDRLPRRVPAFQEKTEHNVNDTIDPSGNPDGWSKEWTRWFALISRLYDSSSWAAGRVALTGSSATLTRGDRIAGVSRVSTGIVTVTLSVTMPDTNYAVLPTPFGSTGGSCTVDTLTTTTFKVYRADIGGVLTDADFCFDVRLGD